MTRPERGSMKAVRLGVWIALHIGRPAARMFLYPICLYFLLSSPAAARASSVYLRRALGRAPRLREIFRHFVTFAACVLDRVFLLNDQLGQFDIQVHDEHIVNDIQQAGGGCVLIGAHFGSFEAARAVGRTQRGLPVSLLMYEENAKKIRAALAAVNPQLAQEVIGLGQLDSMLAVADRLRRGHFVGVLADRYLNLKDCVRHDFLGAKAAFPQGPFRVAMVLQRPIVMMFGVYRGGNRYEVHFEKIGDASAGRPRDTEAWLDQTMRHYVARLEHYCREEPFNWFNFYDFWG